MNPRRVSRQFTIHNMVSFSSYLWFMLIDRPRKGCCCCCWVEVMREQDRMATLVELVKIFGVSCSVNLYKLEIYVLALSSSGHAYGSIVNRAYYSTIHVLPYGSI